MLYSRQSDKARKLTHFLKKKHWENISLFIATKPLRFAE